MKLEELLDASSMHHVPRTDVITARMVQTHQLDHYKVQDVRALKNMPEAARAQQLLEQVARQVQPIMRRRKFRVPLLVEFYPQQSRLLGLNVGGGGGDTREIRVRLRRASAPSSMLPYESVLGTMLHELAHNVRSPHDSQFYKLLDELTQECEELMSKGIAGTGAGFDAPSAGRAGGRPVGRDLPPHEARRLAALAAEKRFQRSALMPGGPVKLGGDPTLRRAYSPREAAAIAAERRARDNVWCPAEQLAREAAEHGGSLDVALQAVLDGANASAADPGSTGDAGPSGSGAAVRAHASASGSTDGPAATAAAQPAAAAEEGQPGGEPVQRPGPASMPPNPAVASACALEAVPRRRRPDASAASAQTPSLGVASPSRLAPSGRLALAEEASSSRLPMVVDLTGQDSDAEDPERKVSSPAPSAKRQRAPAGNGGAGGEWACPQCTLLNRALALQCDACQGVRPASLAVPC